MTPLLWSDLTKREAELQGAKVEPMWKPDASGFLRYCNTTTLADAVTNSEYLLKCALTRRAMAFYIANLCSFDVMEVWHESIMADLVRPPPAGHRSISIDQARRADATLWYRVAEKCRSGIRPDAEGNRPIERAIKELFCSPDVRLLTMPQPGSSVFLPPLLRHLVLMGCLTVA